MPCCHMWRGKILFLRQIFSCSIQLHRCPQTPPFHRLVLPIIIAIVHIKMLHVSTQYTCRCTPQPNVGHFFYVLLNCDFMYWLAFGGANLAGRSCLGAMGGESWSWAMLRRSSRTTSPHYHPLVTQIHSLHWADLILQNLIKGKW